MESKEFKKSIRDNLDELVLMPSEKLWTEVKYRLEKEKRKKRFIFFWFFVGLLSIVTIAYFKLTKIDNNYWAKNNKTIPTIKNSSVSTKKSIEIKDSISLHIEATLLKEQTNQSSVSTKQNKLPLFAPTKTIIRIKPPVFFENKIENDIENKISIIQKGNHIDGKTPIRISNNTENTLASSSTDSIPTYTENYFEPQKSFDTAASSVVLLPQMEDVAKKIKTENVDSITLALQKGGIKKSRVNKSKWQYSLAIFSGKSTLTNKLLFVREKSTLDALTSSGIVGGIPTRTSNDSISKFVQGQSYYFGLDAEKKITKSLTFSTGVYYQYNSVKNAVGNAQFQAYSIGNSSTQTNKFHFINLCTSIKYTAFVKNKISIGLATGFSGLYLFKSNALVFDTSTRLYKKDFQSFNKMQLALNASVLVKYSFNKQFSIEAGPQLQLHLTHLGNGYNYQNAYLKTWGLKATLSLKK